MRPLPSVAIGARAARGTSLGRCHQIISFDAQPRAAHEFGSELDEIDDFTVVGEPRDRSCGMHDALGEDDGLALIMRVRLGGEKGVRDVGSELVDTIQARG